QREQQDERREEDDDDEAGVGDDLVVGLAVSALAAVVLGQRDGREVHQEEQRAQRRGGEAAHPSGRIPLVSGLQRERLPDGIEVLRLDRPERRNALDSATLAALIDTLDELAEDDELRVLVVSTTTERALSAGADVAEPLD